LPRGHGEIFVRLFRPGDARALAAEAVAAAIAEVAEA
jgi:hypothetical protein